MKKEIRQQLNDLKKYLNKITECKFTKFHLNNNYLYFTCLDTYFFAITFDELNKISELFKTTNIEFEVDVDTSYPDYTYTIITLKIKNEILDE